ncbi:hypothetical protein A20C1_00285 [marine actinobacterium PHSC20C1]|nr:hypothetical protein A20C1_00285 [marine actinobacterium PHSC20C1]
MAEEEEEGTANDLDIRWVRGNISADEYFAHIRRLSEEQSKREYRKAMDHPSGSVAARH